MRTILNKKNVLKSTLLTGVLALGLSACSQQATYVPPVENESGSKFSGKNAVATESEVREIPAQGVDIVQVAEDIAVISDAVSDL